MLSYNNKKIAFKSKNTKKFVITTVAAAVVLSFSVGIGVHLYNSSRNGSTVTYANVPVTNSNISGEGSVNGGTKVVKPLTGTVKGDGKNVGALKDYEVKFEDIYKKDGVKTAFLTFDDGPTKNITPQILDILDRYNIKASFFIVGNMAEKYPDMLKKEYESGHAINLHSYSHDYNYIYSSAEAFQGDLEKNIAAIKKALGEDFSTRIYRFPGGSYGKTRAPYKQQLANLGYVHIDWNALTKDAENINDKGHKRARTAPELLEELKKTIAESGNPEDLVILMHDAATKQPTADELPHVIEYLKSQGYNFKTMK